MKKLFCCLMILVLLPLSAGCGGQGGEEHGDPNANQTVPEGSVTLTIEQEADNTVFGIGTELDPHFLAQNVGLSGVSEIGSWECREEDWDLFVERMREMNLKRIRVMLLPSWFAPEKEIYENGNYDWDSAEMESLYLVLDTALELGMKVNITLWGADCAWLKEPGDSGWASYPRESEETAFVTLFAHCIRYLREEKNYSNITEVTLFNEPNSYFTWNNANQDYCDLCREMDASFREAGIRKDVLFNLSDDARSATWLAQTLYNLEGIVDVVNSHTYSFGDTYDFETDTTIRDMSNADICYNLPNYNLALYREMRSGYEDIPHIWGEFGTKNNSGSHMTFDKYLPDRGLEIARIALNMFNMGSSGVSYWVLFSQYYNRSDFNNNYIMDMGLWGFADEGYACRPVYYAFSMLTRFVEEADEIYTIESGDENIVATAFRRGDQWTYCVVNNGDVSKQISFLNRTKFPSEMARYVYDEANVPTDNKVIPSNGKVTADGRVLTDTVGPRSFVVYTDKD